MTDPMLDVNTARPPLAWLPAVPASHHDPRLVARPDLVVCDSCSAVHQRIELAPGHVAHCRRCNALLGRGHVMRVQGLLAFALGALILIVIGNLAPIVSLDLRGIANQVTLPEALRQTWNAGQPLVALLAGLTTLALPLAVTVLRLYLLVPLASGRKPAGFVPVMRMLRFATHWSMVEVFLMGTLVAVVRTAGVANLLPGAGLIAYAALTLLLTSSTAAGLHSLWKMGSEIEGEREGEGR